MNKISATIITFNEEGQIRQCLESLSFVDEIVVVDSFSTDATQEICKEFNNVLFIENKFINYGNQKNYAESQCSNPWILNVDADEVVSDSLKEEIELNLKNQEYDKLPDIFALRRKNFFIYKFTRYGGTYPDYNKRLYKKGKARWTEPQVHEVLMPIDNNNTIHKLNGELLHYTCRSIEDSYRTIRNFAALSAKQLIENDKIKYTRFKLIYKPISKFLELYFVKLGFLDGFLGFYLAASSMYAVFIRWQYIYQYTIESKGKNA